jgi:hypothetical protein
LHKSRGPCAGYLDPKGPWKPGRNLDSWCSVFCESLISLRSSSSQEKKFSFPVTTPPPPEAISRALGDCGTWVKTLHWPLHTWGSSQPLERLPGTAACPYMLFSPPGPSLSQGVLVQDSKELRAPGELEKGGQSSDPDRNAKKV